MHLFDPKQYLIGFGDLAFVTIFAPPTLSNLEELRSFLNEYCNVNDALFAAMDRKEIDIEAEGSLEEIAKRNILFSFHFLLLLR